jgi:N-acylneuraminate cytidylyltransferase
MIGQQRVVALITARAGSKGVPNKNLRPLGGRPLVQWPIENALATPEVDRVIVSTDGEAIAEASRRAGAEVSMRPAPLASDSALSADVVRHHVRELRAAGETARYMVLLQPTTPFRLSRDITACLQAIEHEGLDSVATFTEADLHPHRAWTIQDGRPQSFIAGAVPWLPRQALTPAWQLNGSVYAFVMDALPATGPAVLFGRAGGVLMSKRRSLDIDDELDFVIADALLARGVLDEP